MKNSVYLDKTTQGLYDRLSRRLNMPTSQFLRLLLLEPVVEQYAISIVGIADDIDKATEQAQTTIFDYLKGGAKNEN